MEGRVRRNLTRISETNWRRLLTWLMGLILAGIIIYLIGHEIQSRSNRPLRLIVYAFSSQEEVLTQGIFPAFEQVWETETGEDVIIEGVFGPSGTLSVQITLGAPADVAILSNQRHIDWLKFSKCVDRDANPVMFASTPLVILTRPGNPKGITDFTDLTQPGIRLLHADPGSSGVGVWAVLAEYGSAFLETGDHEAAKTQLEAIWRNVRLMGSSARATLTLFELGAGDALVTYEQEACFAQKRSVPLDVIMPHRTILARHYAVIVDDNVLSFERPVAEAFMAFLLSDEGQHIMSRYYFRPAAFESDLLPVLDNPFTEEDLGGWTQAYNSLIENVWQNNIEPFLELEPVTTMLEIGK
ncbi:MAG: hypothetical protein FJ010_11920 [Chloroflexi bacterium]|nr:hypothetical protein [Chloroflexota bacterium]